MSTSAHSPRRARSSERFALRPLDHGHLAPDADPLPVETAALEANAGHQDHHQQWPACSPRTRVRVWDLPTRLFHWLLLLCVTAAVITAQLGGNWMEWHQRFGASTLALLAFRLVWGFRGPRYARFKSFLYSPRTVFSYLRNPSARHASYVGHSPSAAAWVFLSLAVLLVQALTGLFSSDSISTEGPLVRFGTEEIISMATSLHALTQWLIYSLVGLHVTVVLGLLILKRENLIHPMVIGDKEDVGAPAADDSPRTRLIGMVTMALFIVTALLLL
jgi:cytochrome b